MLKTNSNAGPDLPLAKKHREDASIFQDSLSEAVKLGHKEKVLFHLKKGAKVHIGKNIDPQCGHECAIETPIEEAVKANHHEIMLILYKNWDKSEVPSPGCMLNRLLQSAIQNQNLEIMHELLALGADPNYHIFDHSDEHRFPTLDQALKTGNPEIIKLLLKNGANEVCFISEAIKTKNTLDNVKILLKCGLEVDSTDYYERTPLHNAIIDHGNLEIVSLLIRFGADVNAKDEWKHIPLHYAFNRRIGQFKLLKILMLNGANPYLKDDLNGESTIENALYHKTTTE